MRFQQLLAERGSTVPKVAEAIEESKSTVNRWFNGDVLPRLNQAAKLAAYFGVMLEDLAGVAPPMTPREREALQLIRRLGEDRAIARLLSIDEGGGKVEYGPWEHDGHVKPKPKSPPNHRDGTA